MFVGMKLSMNSVTGEVFDKQIMLLVCYMSLVFNQCYRDEVLDN